MKAKNVIIREDAPLPPGTKSRSGKKGKTQHHPFVDVLVIESKSGKRRWERRWRSLSTTSTPDQAKGA